MFAKALLELAGIPGGDLSQDRTIVVKPAPYEIPRGVDRVQNVDDHILSMDFTDINGKLARKLGWSDDEVSTAELWYKRFLILMHRYPTARLVPTPAMDEMWHAHILDTRRYCADCRAIFGSYRHHTPSYTTDASERALMVDLAATTRQLFLQDFGELPHVVGEECRQSCNCDGGKCLLSFCT